MAIDDHLPIVQSDYQKIALILVEAIFFGDRKTARKWEITTRTIRRYRLMAGENQELSTIFLGKRQEFESNWARNIPAALIAGIDFLTRAAQEVDPTNPEAVEAVSTAVKTLAEIGLTKEIIDAKLSGFNREDGAESNQMASYSSLESES